MVSIHSEFGICTYVASGEYPCIILVRDGKCCRNTCGEEGEETVDQEGTEERISRNGWEGDKEEKGRRGRDKGRYVLAYLPSTCISYSFSRNNV